MSYKVMRFVIIFHETNAWVYSDRKLFYKNFFFVKNRKNIKKIKIYPRTILAKSKGFNVNQFIGF